MRFLLATTLLQLLNLGSDLIYESRVYTRSPVPLPLYQPFLLIQPARQIGVFLGSELSHEQFHPSSLIHFCERGRHG